MSKRKLRPSKSSGNRWRRGAWPVVGMAIALVVSTVSCGDGSTGTTSFTSSGGSGTGAGAGGGTSGTGAVAGAGGTSGTAATGGGTGATGGGTGAAGGGIVCGPEDTGITGKVSDGAQAAIAGARVTLASASAFFETRTDAAGVYTVLGVTAGDYQLGASARGREYLESPTTITTGCAAKDFALGPETNPGSWVTLGDPTEKLGGTNSGVLLPDGRLMYCHDTKDPVIWDPVTNEKSFPPQSPKLQGCHAVTLQPDGRLIYVGGADVPIYGPGTKQVKTFDPVTSTWEVHPDLIDYRWYPTMIPLPDGQLLTVGGGGLNNPVRVKTSELMDPATMTWSPAGDIAIGNEVSPIVLLYSGKALMTHRPPQLFDPATKQWSVAADFVQGNRMANGDHADHELVLLPDGKVVAIGYISFNPGNPGNMVEVYDPDADQWALGASSTPVRSRASTLQLPDKRILVMGGFKEDAADPTPTNEWGQVALTDLYDPGLDAWRRLAGMSIKREYHAMPILVPDGRVFIVGGEGQPGNEPAQSIVEAFSPPYLARGPRPEILELDTTTLARGGTVSFKIAKTSAPTSVVLMGTVATTHFMDSGNGRYLELAFTQNGDEITASIPSDPARSVFGYYLLLVMVDDIPSMGVVVRITS